MTGDDVKAELRRLVLREGWKIETAARRFGVHHSTVRRALAEPEDVPVLSRSVVEPFKPYLIQRLTEAPELSAVRLFQEIRERGYQNGVAQVRRYSAKVRQPRSRKVYLRVETEPGEQAQVDWGHFGYLRVGNTRRPLSCFAMVLSYSRALFIDFALDQRLETFLLMHRRALEFFGGVPKRILYDNLKSVVLHHFGSTVQFNPRFLTFAGHCLFEPTAAPVRYPEAKGRVESSIKYVRHSFFYGQTSARSRTCGSRRPRGSSGACSASSCSNSVFASSSGASVSRSVITGQSSTNGSSLVRQSRGLFSSEGSLPTSRYFAASLGSIPARFAASPNFPCLFNCLMAVLVHNAWSFALSRRVRKTAAPVQE